MAHNKSKKHFPRRGTKHLRDRVNGETEQTQSERITEVQMRKRM
ncbi:YpzG family protein [Halobacillus amylolyticus]|uniref:YpzG family protein n=1 Tax=Halobacillus amylolyticus TaxID=2932259 RepID=A0ABY4HEL4_9BACI|nr:YpzG family protein [Halobacillus amylolyticus]UOR13331.1 YpzG family protein [Halobacillus amylolyticus]